MENLRTILICCSFVCCLAGFVILWIRKARKPRKQNECKDTMFSNDKDPIYEPEYTTTEIHATVAELYCGASLNGMKTPKSVKEFIVVMQTNDEEFHKFSVPEEMYEGFEIGQSGILTLVDGQIYGFDPEYTDK